MPKTDVLLSAPLSRRVFLGATAGLVISSTLRAEQPADEPVAFFHIGDTHYHADESDPAEMDPVSVAVTGRLIETLNNLPGKAIPALAGGGVVAKPRGVVHAGDLTDSGDKPSLTPQRQAMQRTEWAAFLADYGLTGADAKLQFPVYEVHGNHDSHAGAGPVIDAIVERNKRRPGVDHICPNGLHYAWSWGNVRFINLGIIVGQDKTVALKRHYNPADSLDFLRDDLAKNVGDSGKPVVITHHVDVERYAKPFKPEDPGNAGKEWLGCDVAAYYQAIQGFNIAAVLYGHTHVRNVLKWDGQTVRGKTGVPIYNVAKASHYKGDAQGFFYFEIGSRELVVREYATDDRWRTGHWTPQVWRHPMKA